MCRYKFEFASGIYDCFKNSLSSLALALKKTKGLRENKCFSSRPTLRKEKCIMEICGKSAETRELTINLTGGGG